jgi:hypothetical protein
MYLNNSGHVRLSATEDADILDKVYLDKMKFKYCISFLGGWLFCKYVGMKNC